MAMIRRRVAYDPLQASIQPRWLTVRTFGGGLLDAGWRLGEFASSSGAVRHERANEKRMLAIEEQDPEGSGRVAWSGQCVHCDD